MTKKLSKNIIGLLALLLLFFAIELLSKYIKKGENEESLILYLHCIEAVLWIGFLGFISKKEFIKNITITICSTLILLLFIDVVFFLIIYFTPSPIHLHDEGSYFDLTIPDSALGYKPKPSIKTERIFKDHGKTIFDAHFTTDQYSRRTYPTLNISPDKYAIFFGCSMTFGVTNSDSETIPFYVARKSKEFSCYNYAYPGYGTQQMLANLQRPNFRNEIKEGKGIGLYMFIDHHLRRVQGDMLITAHWMGDMPYYILKNDSAIRNGTFRKDRWFISAIYSVLGKSSFLKFFKIDIPISIKTKDYELSTAIIKESRTLYDKQFGNDNFYVVMLPGTDTTILKYLDKEKIKYLNYANLYNPGSIGYSFLPYDPHPTPKANKILAEKLSQDITGILSPN